MTQTLSLYLKENTKHLHDAVEAQFQSQKIFDKTYNLQDYKQIIFLNYLLHEALEKKIFATISDRLAGLLQLPDREKLPLLQKELQLLGIPAKNYVFQDVMLSNEAEAIGALYVIEGSTLGGNVIKKQLAQNPAFENTEFHYFGCYGDKTGELWKNFKEVLDTQFTPGQYTEVLTGTTKAYQLMLEQATTAI